ncbi:MAG: AAA family ATPase [Rhodospirillales bacterium]
MKKSASTLNVLVEGVLPTGLTVLTGSKFCGKSTLVHHVALSVACGVDVLGRLRTKQVDVLCLFLEDPLRRVNWRRAKLCFDSGITGLEYVTIEQPLWTIDQLERYLNKHRRCRLVVIDCIERLLINAQTYVEIIEAIKRLRDIAITRNIAIILTHYVIDLARDGKGLAYRVADCLWHIQREYDKAETIWRVSGRLFESRCDFVRTDIGELRGNYGTITSKPNPTCGKSHLSDWNRSVAYL